MIAERKYPFHLLTDYFCHYHKIIEDTPYKILEIDGKDLFTVNRIDLAAKYFYIKSVETGKNLEYARELYIRHIEAFTDGTNMESGKNEKNSISSYLKEFDCLIANFKEKEFDSSISMIPVGGRNELFDGAHRVACAAYFEKKVTVVRFAHLSVCYDYNFFRKRLLDEKYIESMVNEFCKIRSDIRAFCLWPGACNKKNRQTMKNCFLEEGIPILYSKTIKLSYEEFEKIIYSIHQAEYWVGNRWNHYRGEEEKARLCYGNGDSMKLYLVQCESQEKQIALKEKARVSFGLEKKSLHCTDQEVETLHIIEILLQRGEVDEKNRGKMIGRKIRYLYAVVIHIIKKIIGKPV